MTSARSRKTKAMRLAELGISETQFEQYRKMFCDNRRGTKYLKVGHDGWITQKYQWNDRLVLMHLTHEEVIGLFPASRIDYLMIDIDNHDPKINPPVANRAKEIIKLFDTRPLIYTSSNSGGLRVCYFLDKSYQKTTIHDFAKRRLTDACVKIRSGYIEILAQEKGDRLPFGVGSYIVDPHTLEPLHDVDLQNMINRAWHLHDRKKLHIEDRPVSPSKPTRTERTFKDIVSDLVENGLPPDMTTNVALMKLGWDLMCRRGFSRGEAARFLRNWIRSKHNGNSRRFNSGKIDDLDSHIERVVRSYDREKTNFKSHKPKKPIKRLTIEDVGRIVKVFLYYRAQLAAFSLLEHVKNFGALRECIDIDYPEKEGINNSNYTILGFLQVWEIEIPYTLFVHFDGFDRTHPAKTRKVLEDSGLIRLHRKEDRSKHKCKVYLVCFTFDGDSEEVVSLDEALVKLKSPKELKSEYTRYRVELLLKGEAK